MRHLTAILLMCFAAPSLATADLLAQAVNACQTKSAVADAAADLRAKGFRNFSEADGQTYFDYVAAPALHAFLEVDTQDGLTEAKAAALKSIAAEEEALAPRKAAILGIVSAERSNLISPVGSVVVRMIPTPSVEGSGMVTSCSIDSSHFPTADKIVQTLAKGTENAFQTDYYNPNGANTGGILSVKLMRPAPFEAFFGKPFIATHQINVMFNPTAPSS